MLADVGMVKNVECTLQQANISLPKGMPLN